MSGRTIFKSLALFAAVTLITIGATACKGRTNDNVTPTGDTVEVTPMPSAENDSMNHDAEVMVLPDSIPVPD